MLIQCGYAEAVAGATRPLQAALSSSGHYLIIVQTAVRVASSECVSSEYLLLVAHYFDCLFSRPN